MPEIGGYLAPITHPGDNLQMWYTNAIREQINFRRFPYFTGPVNAKATLSTFWNWFKVALDWFLSISSRFCLFVFLLCNFQFFT